MILSGNDIVKFGIVSDVEANGIQPNSIDLKLTGVYYPVTKPIEIKLTDNDFTKVDFETSWINDYEDVVFQYRLDYDTKYLFGVQKIDLSPRRILDEYREVFEPSLLVYFTAEIKPKSSWSRRGWTMSPNHFDSGFAGNGAVIIRTPQHQDGMPSQITVNTDMYFAQLVVSDAYPTENYNGQYQGSKF